ncbi:hypothetical protein [Pseudomonas sp. JL2]|uniref:hypothetical protein n=1 Tax=Pseudomonas sp. JL2 TaxID=2919942 RepID=UPI00286FCB34|nr:hypothetical protein [Pseudomonas sp. JL2]
MPPVRAEQIGQQLAVLVRVRDRLDVAQVVDLVVEIASVFTVKAIAELPIALAHASPVNDCLSRKLHQGVVRKAHRAHAGREVADDVVLIQPAKELSEGVPIPHSAPVGVPALVPATDGDFALAWSQVFQEHRDRIQALRTGDNQLRDCRPLNAQRLGLFVFCWHEIHLGVHKNVMSG